MQIGFIVILIIAIFIAIFAIQNGTPVPVDLFLARYEMPLAVIMMICIVLGAVIVLILGTTRQFRKRSEQKDMKNKIKDFEDEKAQVDINIKALELDKENLSKSNDELSEDNAGLNDMIEELNQKNTELSDKNAELEGKINELEEKIRDKEEVLDTQVQEDEGVIQINHEENEVESQ